MARKAKSEAVSEQIIEQETVKEEIIKKEEPRKSGIKEQLKNEAIIMVVSVILALAVILVIGGISTIRKSTSAVDNTYVYESVNY